MPRNFTVSLSASREREREEQENFQSATKSSYMQLLEKNEATTTHSFSALYSIFMKWSLIEQKTSCPINRFKLYVEKWDGVSDMIFIFSSENQVLD